MPPNRAAPLWRVRILVVAIVGVAAASAGTAAAGVQKVEWVSIDGAKTPEQIPEWSAWEDVFSTIAGGSQLLPSKVLFLVSEDEAKMIRRESEASVKRSADYNARLLAAKKELAAAPFAKQLQRMRDIRLECRWENLHARDRIMAALNPLGRAALREFADQMKAGTTFTIARSELWFFRLPQ